MDGRLCEIISAGLKKKKKIGAGFVMRRIKKLDLQISKRPKEKEKQKDRTLIEIMRKQRRNKGYTKICEVKQWKKR